MGEEGKRRRQYSALRDASPAWRLLSRDSAPMILSFVADLFEGTEDVAIETARLRLVSILESDGIQDPPTIARSYLNSWIDDGILREQNQSLSVTAATQSALQFVASLGSRDMTATASHLETVNEEMRRLLVALSPDIEERQRIIEQQIRDLESAKERLLRGDALERTPAQRRELVRHVFGLAHALTQDFRYLEDEMRRHELEIHQRVLNDQETRGTVLSGVLDAEDLMRQSPAGMAFDGFYSLLGDDEKSDAFRAQVRRLFSLGIEEYLGAEEARYLSDMVNELLAHSERVIERRRAATESLKAYMLSGSQEEHRAVDRLIKSVMGLATTLKGAVPANWRGWHQPTELTLDTGRFSLRSPAVMATTMPAGATENGEIVVVPVSRVLSRDALGKLSGFSIAQLASRTRVTLRNSGPRTIGELAHLQPIRGGIEEVLALLRLARATGGVPLNATEEIYVTDEARGLLKVSLPSLLMTPDGFPDDLGEISP